MTSKSKVAISRDNNWLLSRLDFIWSKYFADIPQTNKPLATLGTVLLTQNKVFIKFGRNTKFRLGSIRLNTQTKASYITITSMFKDLKIPSEVVDHTIGHELVHYAHGFSSVHPRLHRYPHAGGVVRREMADRGMEHLYGAYKAWMKEYRKYLLANRLNNKPSWII